MVSRAFQNQLYPLSKCLLENYSDAIFTSQQDESIWTYRLVCDVVHVVLLAYIVWGLLQNLCVQYFNLQGGREISAIIVADD